MLTLHILSMLFSLGVVYTADKEALSWVRGSRETLGAKRLHTLHLLMWLGLSWLILTGAVLAYPMLGYLLRQPLFEMKLLFVAVLLVNAILIGRLMHVAALRPFASLTWEERLPLITSGVISFFSWSAAIVLALVVFR